MLRRGRVPPRIVRSGTLGAPSLPAFRSPLDVALAVAELVEGRATIVIRLGKSMT